MINRLMRTFQREHLLDWVLMGVLACICVPACFSIGLSQPVIRELVLNPLFNPILAIGFILLGLVIGFWATAWKRGRYAEVIVEPKMGNVILVFIYMLKHTDKALLLIIGGYLVIFKALSLLQIPVAIYAMLMGSVIILAMNLYRKDARYVNPQGLSKISPDQLKNYVKLMKERRNDSIER